MSPLRMRSFIGLDLSAAVEPFITHLRQRAQMRYSGGQKIAEYLSHGTSRLARGVLLVSVYFDGCFLACGGARKETVGLPPKPRGHQPRATTRAPSRSPLPSAASRL